MVSFEVKGEHITPVAPATMGQVTKGREWFNKEIKDERLWSEKPIATGVKAVTIWGIESDAADRELIQKRFLEEVSKGTSISEVFI